jgi:hypothetical protein
MARLAITWLIIAQLSAGAARAEQPSGMSLVADTISRRAEQPPAIRRDQIQFDATRFDSVTAITLRGLFEDAVEMGLPTRPLINRALEGAARRMSSERILKVVREHAAALSSAREQLGPGSTEAELDAAAMALRSGIDEPTLAAVRRSRPAGSAVTALVVLTDLVRRGVPRPEARDAVTSLSRLPRSDDALLGLQSTVAKNAQRGPGMALDALNRYVRGTAPGSITPSTPATTDRKPVRPPDP